MTEAKALYCYEAHVTFPHDGRETSLSILYLADDAAQAVRHAVAWAKNRAKALEWPTVGSIKVHQYAVRRPEPNGYINSGCLAFHIFEWKYDWPGTLEQYVESFTSKLEPT